MLKLADLRAKLRISSSDTMMVVYGLKLGPGTICGKSVFVILST